MKIKEIKFTPKTILYFLALLWIVFSLVYISWGIWQNYKNIQLVAAYERGTREMINQLFLLSAECQPVRVTDEARAMELIDIACLEQPLAEPLPETLPEL